MLSRDTVVASRYELIECLGAGAMGEVWRARDTRFESRLVAVKFLREDETLKEDAINRDRMVIRLDHQAARGGITGKFAVDVLASALAINDLAALKTKVMDTFGASEAIEPAAVTTLFDALVNDPAFNENARMRAKMRRLFRDEANTVANLRHDNIVSIFDYGDHDGIPYLVMDYIEGRTLFQVLQAQEKLERLRRLQLMEDLCAGLGYAHRHKLVHRDIKPANLIIDGSTASLKILDFGVVRRLGSKSTLGVPVGTFCYMSPEQTRGAATLDHRSDIFAVGLVFYELMAGRKAFPPGKNINELVARIQREPPTPLRELMPTVPEAIEKIINKAVEKQPEDRYQDLAVMGREITRIRVRLEAEEQSDRTASLVPRKPPLTRPSLPSVNDLLANAERSFTSGNDQETIATCQKIIALKPDFQPALSLLARSEARLNEGRLREALQQAEGLMARSELTSAEAVLDRARKVNRSSSRIQVMQARIEVARAAEHDRTEEQAREQPKPRAPVVPPAAPKPIDLDADAVTVPIRRDQGRQPLARPAAPASPGRPPEPKPQPPQPSVTPTADHGETQLIRPIAAPPRFQQTPAKAPLPRAAAPPAAPAPARSNEASPKAAPSKQSGAATHAVPFPQKPPAPMMDLPLQSTPTPPKGSEKPTVMIPSRRVSAVPPAAPQAPVAAKPATSTSNARVLWIVAIVVALLFAALIYFVPRFISRVSWLGSTTPPATEATIPQTDWWRSGRASDKERVSCRWKRLAGFYPRFPPGQRG